MSMPEITTSVQDQILESVKAGQDAIVDAVRNWSENVGAALPSLPSLPELPLVGQLPKPSEVVDSSYDFAKKLLYAQRDFATSVLEAMGAGRGSK